MTTRRLYPWMLLLLFAPLNPAMSLEKGRDYIALPKPQPVETGSKIEVREFFWYGCPHCYALEPTIAAWLKRKPAYVEFIRTPATAPNWLTHAQAYYAFAALNATAKTHDALFRAIHQQNRRLNDESSLAQFAAEQGIDAKKFIEAFNSFGVRTNVEKAKRLSAAYEVSSVPMLAVDGKYLTSASMTGSEDAMMKALDQLVQQARQERGSSAPKTSAK